MSTRLNWSIPIRLLFVAALLLGLIALVGVGWFLFKVNTMHNQVIALNAAAKTQRVHRLYLDRLAALERFKLYDDVSDSIRHFAEHADKFVPIEAVAVSKVCGPEMRFTKNPDYVFFGARILIVPDSDGDGVPDVLALSYLGQNNELHGDQAFSAVISSNSIAAEFTRLTEDSGLITQWLDRRLSRDLMAGSVYRPFGYNSDDLDGDGRSDFILGDELYLSGKFEISNGKFGIFPHDIIHVGRDSIFLRSHGQVNLVTLDDNRLIVRTWNADTRDIVEVNMLPLISKASDSHAPFKLYPLPDLDGDQSEEFAIVQPSSFEIYSNILAAAPEKLWTITDVDTVSLVGGFADYDGDGRQDFWLAQRGYSHNESFIGRALLISSERLSKALTPEIPLTDAVWFELRGSELPTDVRGIGATVSLRSGDIDGDGLPDFSVSGHRHLSEAGALYIVPGYLIHADQTLDVMNAAVMKLRAMELGQLAPPFVHWDATDYTGDGLDDIVISADNDLCSGLGSGAVYVVDGANFVERWKAITPTATPTAE